MEIKSNRHGRGVEKNADRLFSPARGGEGGTRRVKIYVSTPSPGLRHKSPHQPTGAIQEQLQEILIDFPSPAKAGERIKREGPQKLRPHGGRYRWLSPHLGRREVFNFASERKAFMGLHRRSYPRILLLGKRGSVVLWLENLFRACQRLGYPTEIFAVNGDTLMSRLHAKWTGRSAAKAPWMLARFAHTLARFRPDRVIVAGVFGVPPDYYHLLHEIPHRPLIAGLVGDRFTAEGREQADRCDRLYCTDTRFIQNAATLGFVAPARYLPLAADPELFTPRSGPRNPQLLFVASRTEFRETIVHNLRDPARIIGTDWSTLASTGFHHVTNRKIRRSGLIRLYQRHLAVLNVRNEANVEHGLNQRSFEPLACGSVVVNDDLADIPLCFEPDREILVYRDADELNAWVDRLQSDPALARRIAEAGRRRVLAEHTYLHRVTSILDDLER